MLRHRAGSLVKRRETWGGGDADLKVGSPLAEDPVRSSATAACQAALVVTSLPDTLTPHRGFRESMKLRQLLIEVTNRRTAVGFM